MRCVVIGGERAGKRTFIGCFYRTLISYANKNSSRMRVYFSPTEIKRISILYERIISPNTSDNEESTIADFHFEYSLRKNEAKIFQFLFKNKGWFNDTLHFHIFSTPLKLEEELPPSPLLNANIVIYLVNLETLIRPGCPAPTDEDHIVNSMALIHRFNKHYKDRNLLSILVFTKYDLFYKNSRLISKVAMKSEKYDRNQYGMRILQTFFPKIEKEIKHTEQEKMQVRFFLSEVDRLIQKDEEIITPNGASEKIYSYWEYYNLIEEIFKYSLAYFGENSCVRCSNE